MKLLALLLLPLLAASNEVFDNMCTTIGVGPGGTASGASIVTHTADCDDCDFRLAKTPKMEHPEGAKRPIYRYHRQYPRLVAEERGDTWKKENLETKFADTYASASWVSAQLVGYIDQVPSTHGLFEALFGMMNDAGVAIGESTCAAALTGRDPRPCPDCEGPLVDVGAVSLLALERCDTARCAVEMMGALAVKHGYYAASTEEGDAGEALIVSDPDEVYMMHLSPDDTGLSAVWVAYRLPEDHVTAAANSYVIRGVDTEDPNYLYSDNLWEVAERSGRAQYDTARAPNGQLDFAMTFSPDEYAKGMLKKPEYSTDRVWRVFSVLAPSRGFERTHSWLGDNLPLSVKVEKEVTVQDIMALNRDHYEGSDMDLTKGFAAGPFGSPIRYDPGYGFPGQTGTEDPKDNENGMTKWDRMHGAFPRAIGIMRTSWHFVAESRPNVPREMAGVMWYSQYQPSAGAYAPLYSSIEAVPEMYTRGSLYEYTEESSFWKFCTVGNYAQLAWKYIFPPVKAKQEELESGFLEKQVDVDKEAARLFKDGKDDEAVALLTKFSTDSAETIGAEWTKLLHYLFAKYHDGYTMILDEPVFRAVEYFYPRWWLVLTDYFTNVVEDHYYDQQLPSGYDTLDNVFGEKKKWVMEKLGMSPEGAAEAAPVALGGAAGGGGHGGEALAVVGVVCGLVGFVVGSRKNVRSGYSTIGDSGVDVRV